MVDLSNRPKANRRGNNDNDDQASVVSRVTIDGRTYVSGPVYDANGNLIN